MHYVLNILKYNSAIKIIGKKEGELMTLSREAKTVWDMVHTEKESRVHVWWADKNDGTKEKTTYLERMKR